MNMLNGTFISKMIGFLSRFEKVFSIELTVILLNSIHTSKSFKSFIIRTICYLYLLYLFRILLEFYYLILCSIKNDYDCIESGHIIGRYVIESLEYHGLILIALALFGLYALNMFH